MIAPTISLGPSKPVRKQCRRRLSKQQPSAGFRTGAATENVTCTHDALVVGSFNKGRLTRIVDRAGASDFKCGL